MSGVVRRIGKECQHKRRKRVEESPARYGLPSALQIHLQRGGLSHHLYAGRAECIEVARHADVAFAIELKRNLIDAVVRVDACCEQGNSVIRHCFCQYTRCSTYCRDQRRCLRVGRTADLDLTTWLEGNAR